MKTKIKWDKTKDEIYAIFGTCECGNHNVIKGSKYCSDCGKEISNPK